MWFVGIGTTEKYQKYFQTFLVPIALEERRDKLGVKLTKDVIIVEQDEEMKSKLVPHSGSIEFLWIIEMDSSSIDAVSCQTGKFFVGTKIPA